MRSWSRSKKDLLLIADPRLVKILAYDGQIVGYLFGFHDLSRALQKNAGRLGPIRAAAAARRRCAPATS